LADFSKFFDFWLIFRNLIANFRFLADFSKFDS